MAATQEMLSSLLQGFNADTGARGSAVVTRDGLPLVSALPPTISTETFAAMTATMMGAADTAASQVTDQTAKRIDVVYDGWRLITYGAGPDVLLVVLATDSADPQALGDAGAKLADEIREAF